MAKLLIATYVEKIDIKRYAQLLMEHDRSVTY